MYGGSINSPGHVQWHSPLQSSASFTLPKSTPKSLRGILHQCNMQYAILQKISLCNIGTHTLTQRDIVYRNISASHLHAIRKECCTETCRMEIVSFPMNFWSVFGCLEHLTELSYEIIDTWRTCSSLSKLWTKFKKIRGNFRRNWIKFWKKYFIKKKKLKKKLKKKEVN